MSAKSRTRPRPAVVKTFSFNKRDDQPEPHAFKLNGQTLHAVPEMDGFAMLEFGTLIFNSSLLASDDDTNVDPVETMRMMSGLVDFFRSVIMPEDYDRFVKIVKQPGSGIGIEQLAEIGTGLMELYSERPTSPPSD